MLNKKKAIQKLNELGNSQTPFSFYCDWLGEEWCIESLDSLSSFTLEISSLSTASRQQTVKDPQWNFSKEPVDYGFYNNSFKNVVREINFGNSFLTNLTYQTPIQTNLTLNQIFELASAKYKLLVPNEFVVFSPEIFVQIKSGNIYSFPMKGTIDASLPDAANLVMNDPKELAEHVTIVDLIRNDLSTVADKVEVKRFRYLEEIATNHKRLLQVSSEIQGRLSSDWNSHLGTILSTLLPAGSISGAPKPETIRIIHENESYKRGFYTGICGHFNGASLDTGVMIRFIKQENEKLFYCSGGGITSFSQSAKEYQEMVDKIYLPL